MLTPGGGSLVTDPAQVTPGTSEFGSTTPIGPNYSETSALDQSRPVSDPPGTSISFAGPALDSPLDVVGSPRLTVTLDSPAQATQGLGPEGRLVFYAKLYDVGPDGAVELPHRLISPVRVTDVTKPITVELPGIVHRFEAGHRLAVVLAAGDLAYRGSTDPQAAVLTTGTAVQELTLPVVG
jgi:ABC-2 type transport system ATP-binding protein